MAKFNKNITEQGYKAGSSAMKFQEQWRFGQQNPNFLYFATFFNSD
jgi:hypothetical protein